jgi:hypothetical protein
MAQVGPKIEITHGGKKYTVFSKVTHLVPRTENGEEAEYVVFGPEKEGVISVVVLAPKDLNEEALALRVKWFNDVKPRCVKCGAAYNGKNHFRVVAIRNGTYYLDAVCDKCEPRITWLFAIVIGRS